MMKNKLDFHSPEVVNIFDEASLWAAPFGRLLLENIPMKPKANVLDIGFGLGLPLVELSQRFGEDSTIYGIDVWESGIARCREKIRVLGLENINIFEQDASNIPLEDNSIDLITSNLGINNFEQKETVFKECFRVLKKGGHLSIATNTMETFEELFDIFSQAIKEEDLDINPNLFTQHRGTKESIINEIEAIGFTCSKAASSQTNMRFTNAMAVLNHSLIRIGFMASWESIIPKEKQQIFFDKVLLKIGRIIRKKGEFSMRIPILYLEFHA